MAQAHSPLRAASRPFGAQLDTLRGEPTPTAGLRVTPIARRLTLWWPGGAWVYAWPIAIEYPDGQRARRRRIPNMRMRSQATCVALGIAAAVLFLTRSRNARRQTPA